MGHWLSIEEFKKHLQASRDTTIVERLLPNPDGQMSQLSATGVSPRAGLDLPLLMLGFGQESATRV
jgi:hypothetical protein